MNEKDVGVPAGGVSGVSVAFVAELGLHQPDGERAILVCAC